MRTPNGTLASNGPIGKLISLMAIEISNESGVAVDQTALLSLTRYALREMSVNPMAELSIVFAEPEYMAALNKRWMGKDGPTDVLAFPMEDFEVDYGPGRTADEQPALLGDIVLCPEVAAAQAASAGHLIDDELQLLTVHGILHLLGYDHADARTEQEMFGLQGRLVMAWRDSHGVGDTGFEPPKPRQS